MPPKPPPFTFTVPSTLTPFSVPMSSYLQSQPEYDAIASGLLVFAQNKDQDEILLLQRAPHDTMPNRWEFPGGAVDPEDASILHGAARELWEETGMLVTAFKAQVGEGMGMGMGFRTSRGLWVCRLVFEVEVDSPGNGVREVTLDENEHQNFAWASEEECRAKRVRGKEGVLGIEFTSVTVEETVLGAFRTRKLEKEG